MIYTLKVAGLTSLIFNPERFILIPSSALPDKRQDSTQSEFYEIVDYL